jgi:hypothetical protein
LRGFCFPAAPTQTIACSRARGDIPDADGRTVADIMRRKQDAQFQRIAEKLARGRGSAV